MLNRDAFGQPAVDREMQHCFPHFGDRHVAAVECRIHVISQRSLGIGCRDAGQRDEAPVTSAQSPAVARPRRRRSRSSVDVRRSGVVGRGKRHHLGEGALAALEPFVSIVVIVVPSLYLIAG